MFYEYITFLLTKLTQLLGEEPARMFQYPVKAAVGIKLLSTLLSPQALDNHIELLVSISCTEWEALALENEAVAEASRSPYHPVLEGCPVLSGKTIIENLLT